MHSKDSEKILMVFGRYAQYYDVIYKRKDYKKECVYLEELFRKYSQRKVKTVLDLGCGTANHIIPFIENGYKVTGVDASSQMLKLAVQKLDQLNLKAELSREKLQSFQMGCKFDVILCLFSVIDYITRRRGLLLTLENIARHMKRNSLFVFDFWNESAVNGHYSPRKTNFFKVNDKVFERSSITKIYPSKRICEVSYTCSLRRSGRLIRQDREKHVLRYFSIDEMRGYLQAAGLKMIDAHPFLNPNGRIRKNTWDVTVVAQRS